MPQAGKTGQVISGTYQKAKNIRLADNQTSAREPFRFPIPSRTSYLLPRTCFFVGKHANVLSSFSQTESPPGFRSDV